MKIYTYEGKANISGDRIHQARAPALISAQFYFFDPPLLFPPGPRGSEKTPSYLPNFCALEPAKLNVRARSTYRARAGAGAYRRV